MSNQIAIACKSLSKSYQDGKQKLTIIREADLCVEYGQSVAILGLSGSGKTTLLNLLGGLDYPSSGQVYLNGERFDHLSQNKKALRRNPSLGFIYQFHHLLPEFTALENVLMPLMMRKTSKKNNITLAQEILDTVGLSHRMHHKPSELSGGERQRVAIARAVVTKPKCVLADEPTGNLDSHNSGNIILLMQSLSEKFNISFIVVTHDRDFANNMDQVYEITDGRLIKT